MMEEVEGEKEEKARFLTDRMLGKLTTWLRILGYDTIYAGSIKWGKGDEDRSIASLAKKEGRVLLTRDKGLANLAKKEGVRCVYLKADNVIEQLRELLRHGMNINLEPTMVRCSECNKEIRRVKEVEEDLLRSKDYVPKDMIGRKEFWICDNCGKIYWEGSHWRNIEGQLEKLKDTHPLRSERR
ncbi:MAG: DUF5615 family PIN-like protein [Candidatus Methanospirareceae archaeon]